MGYQLLRGKRKSSSCLGMNKTYVPSLLLDSLAKQHLLGFKGSAVLETGSNDVIALLAINRGVTSC